MKQISLLFVVSIFITSCKGQVATNKPKDLASEPQAITGGQPKLIKTQGTNEYANVHCGLQDKAGNLWFSTTGEGVYRYDGKSFTNFTKKDGLSSNDVWRIYEDKDGNLWFGTSEGACRYDGKNFISIPIQAANGTNFYPSTSPNNNSSIKKTVLSIMQDKTGKLWFGTSEGVFCYNGISFTQFLENDSVRNNSGLHLDNVEYMLEDKAGNIWFGGRISKGVFYYDGKSLTSLKPDGENWLWPVLEDKTGNIWLSNWAGAYRYDGKSFINFTKKEGFCNKDVTCILEDKNGNIWFGSDDKPGGMCYYDGKSFTHFTTKDGLINNSVWTIVEDKTGNLWIGTRNTGLCRYDGKTFTNFSE